eukprot:623180-Amphidinium_carterae.1
MVSSADVRAFYAHYGARQKRLKQLIQHNAEALKNCRHFVTNFLDARPVCVNCGAHGNTSFKLAWLRNYCPRSYHMQEDESVAQIRVLQCKFSDAREVIAAVAAIFRTL